MRAIAASLRRLTALGDGGVELDHAVEEMVVVDGEGGAAGGIGAGVVGGDPVGLDVGVVEGAGLGFAHVDVEADVLLDSEGAGGEVA